MIVEAEISSTLQVYAGLIPLVSTRIYPLLLPQTPVLPAIVYQKISGPRSYSHSGDSNLTFTRYQFSIWAHTYAIAKSVAAQLRACLSGKQFTTIRAAFVANEMDGYDSETKDFRIIMDFMFWVAES